MIATDTDSDSIYYSLSGTDASALSIGSSSGVLVFNEAPDYENKSNYSAVVTASDGVNSADQSIFVTVIDANDSAPIFTSSSSFTVVENQSLAIGNVNALDPDGDSVSYSLSGSDASLLSIDENNGELTFKSLPDYETKITYLLTVTATDGVYPTDQNISISVTDIDDTAPEFASPSKYTVQENELSIATITATDVSESIAYSVVGSDSSFVSGSSSGVLVFNTAPDYGSGNEYNFIVEASDGVNIGYLGVLVEILNIEDADPCLPLLHHLPLMRIHLRLVSYRQSIVIVKLFAILSIKSGLY